MSAPPSLDLDSDRWLTLAIGSLWFCGAVYLLIAMAMPLLLVLQLLVDSMGGIGPVESVFLLVFFVVGVATAAGNILLARALQRRARWGLGWGDRGRRHLRPKWLIVAGAIYAPSGCLPFGVIILYAVLRPGFREAYLQVREVPNELGGQALGEVR